MVDFYTRGMSQQCTYWAPALSDGEGGNAYGAPVVFACRWQTKTTMYKNAQGELRVGDYVIYVAGRPEVNGMIALGALSDSTPTREAKRIEVVQESPSYSNDKVLIKVIA